MNRFRRYLFGTAATLLTAAIPAVCADLLVDDFTDPGASHGKWVNKSESYMSHSVANGSCTLDNSSATYSGEYFHDFGTNKPATFTLSYILKSVQGDAGAFFCRQPGSALSGYLITLKDGSVAVWKMTNGSSGSPVFSKSVASFDLASSGNKLTVSKSGTKFNVFVNNDLAGSFTDDTYNSGDLSLLIDPNTKAVFGTIQVTDAFTDGSPRTSFSDDFNGNNLKYWAFFETGSPTYIEAGGKLTVNTKSTANDVLWMYIDFEHTDFTAKVEASHRSGSKSSLYGFVLIGESVPGQTTIPMASFAITGERGYAIWKTGATAIEPVTNQAIMGAGSSGLFFVDTLEIKKNANSSEYEFFANGTSLAAYPAANIGFKVAGVGIFCYSDLEVAFDNFSVLKDGTTTSINRGSTQISRHPSSLTTRNQAFYDLRGRKRYVATTSTQGRATTRAAGIYVNKNGRDVAVKKGRVAID